MVGRGNGSPGRPRRILWGTARILLRLVRVVAVAFVVVLVALALPPVRGGFLRLGLMLADGFLPGQLEAGRLAWPGPGRLVFEDVLWLTGDADAPGDTLVDLRRLEIALRLGALRDGDAEVDSLVMLVRNLDLPRLVAAFPASPADTASASPDTATGAADLPVLRDGAAADLPSVHIRSLRLAVERAVLAPDIGVADVHGTATVAAEHGRDGAAVELALGGRSVGRGDRPWSADLPRLVLAGRYGPGRGQVGLDSLVVRDVLWRSGPPDAPGDTVLDLRRLEIALRLGALHDGDAEVDSLVVLVRNLDLPRLVAAFPASLADTASAPPNATAGAADRPVLRAGAAAGLPSVDIRSLRLAVERAVLAPDIGVADVHGTATVAAEHGRDGAAVELALGGRSVGRGDRPWSADLPRLVLAGRYGPGRGQVGLDSLVVRDVLWRSGPPDAPGDTVLDLRRLELVLERDAQPDGDVRVDSLVAMVRSLDLPGLAALLPAAADTAQAAAEDGPRPAGGSFPLDGAAAEGPSLDLVNLRVAVERARLAPELDVAGVGCQAALATVSGRPGAAVRVEAWGQAAGAGARPWVAELSRLTLAGHYGPGWGQVALDSLVATVPLAGPAHWRERWQGSRPAQVKVAGRADVTTKKFDLELHGSLDAPGAALAGPDWPASLPSAQYERAAGRFRAEAAGGEGEDLVLAVDLDLSDTDGLERGRVRADFRLGPGEHPWRARVRLEDLDVAVPGMSLQGQGTAGTDTVDLVLRAEVASPVPLFALAGPDLAEAELGLDLDLLATGPRSAPRGALDLVAWYDGPRGTLSRGEIHASGDDDLATARLRVTGLRLPGSTPVDSVFVDLGWSRRDSLPLALVAAANTPRVAFATGLRADLDSVVTVRLDSLELVASGQDLRLTRPVVARWDSSRGHLALSRFELSGEAGNFHLEGEVGREKLAVRGGVDLVLKEAMLQLLTPGDIWSRDGGADLQARGDLELAGTPAEPSLTGHLAARILPHRKRPVLGVDLNLGMTSGDTAGIAVNLAAAADDEALLRATAIWPGRFDLATGRWTPDPEQPLVLDLPGQQLALKRLKPFLPPDSEVEGILEFAARASLRRVGTQGAPADSTTGRLDGDLSGTLAVERMSVVLPDRSRLVLGMDCSLEGELSDPRLAGKITVVSGFIRLPEIPRNLHPPEGDSMLWELVRADTALVDSLAAAGMPRWGPEKAAAPATPLPDLDLHVHLPGNLRIHGYGLAVELGGDIEVTRGYDEDGVPGSALHGGVEVVNGTLRFMNRNFEFQRGEVTFTGSVPANPELNLSLDTEISGTAIKVQVTGRMDAPVITMTSEPSMSEADIVSYLIFGRALNDLDEDQRGQAGNESNANEQLRQNMAALAMVFGTKGLQDTVTSSLGVDMVEMGADSKGGSTLSAGKYISTDLLLKYHHSLEKSGTYFMTLEYAISRAFRLVTTYAQGEEASGLELKWLRRY